MFGDARILPTPARALARELAVDSPRAENAAPAADSLPALDTRRPVLIIDGGSRADLGLVRSLGFAGIPVHLLTAARASVTTQSRYVTQTHAFPPFAASDPERIARIRAVAKSMQARPIILASGCRSLRFLSSCRSYIADFVDHDLPDARTVANCLDGARFAELGAQLSLPVPASWIPREHAYRVGPNSEVMSVHVYVEPSGRILGSFTSVEAMPSAPDMRLGTADTSRRNEDLAALVVDIVEKLRYCGFAILRFKRDTGQDSFRLIEINCHYGSGTELPSRCGCNFPAAAYATVTGQAAPILAQREGVRCWEFFALDDPAPFFWQLFRRKAD